MLININVDHASSNMTPSLSASWYLDEDIRTSHKSCQHECWPCKVVISHHVCQHHDTWMRILVLTIWKLENWMRSSSVVTLICFDSYYLSPQMEHALQHSSDYCGIHWTQYLFVVKVLQRVVLMLHGSYQFHTNIIRTDLSDCLHGSYPSHKTIIRSWIISITQQHHQIISSKPWHDEHSRFT
jgi:hypothetical protein